MDLRDKRAVAEDVIGVIFAGFAVNYRNDGSCRETRERGIEQDDCVGRKSVMCEIFESHGKRDLSLGRPSTRGVRVRYLHTRYSDNL